jgi:hypothetical protein
MAATRRIRQSSRPSISRFVYIRAGSDQRLNYCQMATISGSLEWSNTAYFSLVNIGRSPCGQQRLNYL